MLMISKPKIKIQYIDIYFLFQEMAQIAISLWFKRDKDRSGVMTLLSNDDCVGGGLPSIHIHSTKDTVGGGIRTNQNLINVFRNIPVSSQIAYMFLVWLSFCYKSIFLNHILMDLNVVPYFRRT